MAKLTEKQKDLFPQMLAGYVSRNQGKGIEAVLAALSEASATKVYAICEAELLAVADAQKRQLEDARADKVL